MSALSSSPLLVAAEAAHLAVAPANPSALAVQSLSTPKTAAGQKEVAPTFAEKMQTVKEHQKSSLFEPSLRLISRHQLQMPVVAEPLVSAVTQPPPVGKTPALVSAEQRQPVVAPVSLPPSLQNSDAPAVAKEPPLMVAVLAADSAASSSLFLAALPLRRLAPQTYLAAAVAVAVASAPLPITFPSLPPPSYPLLLFSSSPRLRL